MREAIGGSWILYIFFVILFVFVCFMAFVMNYASAYRTNNYIVSKVEQYEGNVVKSNLQSEVKSAYGYTGDIQCTCKDLGNDLGSVYTVKTFVTFELPLIDTFNIGITTDSKTVYNVKCSSTAQFCSK